jgi:flotillin
MVDQIPVLAESAAKAISNIKFDKVVVWEGGNANGPSGTAGFIQNMAKSMPPMMEVLRTVAGVELPAFLGTMTPETTPSAVANGDGATHTVVAPVKLPADAGLPMKGDGAKKTAG